MELLLYFSWQTPIKAIQLMNTTCIDISFRRRVKVFAQSESQIEIAIKIVSV